MPECADMKESMLRLRELREKLCEQHNEWKQGFEIRDFIVSELKELHEMICDRKVRRQKIEDKSATILSHFSAIPDKQEGDSR
jgi:hypothetical protein